MLNTSLGTYSIPVCTSNAQSRWEDSCSFLPLELFPLFSGGPPNFLFILRYFTSMGLSDFYTVPVAQFR